MPYEIITLEEARIDLITAYNYYEDKRHGLGEDFLEEVKRKYAVLFNNPYLFGYITDKGIFRDVKINRFPYVIVFEISGNKVIISSIHNTHKRSLY